MVLSLYKKRTDIKMKSAANNYPFFVDKPKGMYRGHVPTKLVKMKTAASMPSIIAAVPDICPAK